MNRANLGKSPYQIAREKKWPIGTVKSDFHRIRVAAEAATEDGKPSGTKRRGADATPDATPPPGWDWDKGITDVARIAHAAALQSFKSGELEDFRAYALTFGSLYGKRAGAVRILDQSTNIQINVKQEVLVVIEDMVELVGTIKDDKDRQRIIRGLQSIGERSETQEN